MGKPVDKPGSVVDNHSSRRTVTGTLKQPTRKQREPRLMLPYLALLRMGFAVPSVLPRPRWALTPPFHPCRPGLPRSWAVYSLLHFPSPSPCGL